MAKKPRWAVFAPNLYNKYYEWTHAKDVESQLQEEAYEQNLALQEQQQEYEKTMSNTQYQRQVADMEAAGLNVGAIGGGGSNATAAGGTGLSTATPKQTHDAQTGHEEEGIDEITNALICNNITKVALAHPEEILEQIYKTERKVNSNAREVIYSDK